MDFLSNLHMDVKLLLVASALALLAALVSGSKKKEHRYMALFAVLMVTAGWRFQHQAEQDPAGERLSTDTTVGHARNIARSSAR